ncbi:MAG: hypothetical protein HO274_01250 [Ferrovum myxofaciens]|uniref:nickel-dependent hydrogenase large subunit n=1 Tax=Ferrovum myxofaciens TaxID=416213 RepID=UPI00235315AE|nr:nickel-dependent hydrogenase large subunit [Ferrovum myxofaciens]QKE40109.1 MAG: hypothetical protein HO274_01250 [Ferrovum myxofaciens]
MDVLGIEVKSTRPPAYRLLSGKSPEDAVKLVPLLFSVCGKAQQAAALATVSAAQGRDMQQLEKFERAVLCEAMQEYLWKFLLDWPKLLGLPQLETQFIRWHAALNVISTDKGNAEDLLAEMHQVLLGMTAKEWQQLDTHDRLLECIKDKQGLLAPIILALEFSESRLDFSGVPTGCSLMPTWTPTEVSRKFAYRFGTEFAKKPQLNGNPLETGALAKTQHLPFVRDILRKRPARLLARLIARLVDFLEGVQARRRIEQITVANGIGLSMVQTARGMLLHHVRIEAGRIAQYLIVAPTEWNFHPQGALTYLIGFREGNMTRLVETAKLFVMSLDPCVDFEIEVVHA